MILVFVSKEYTENVLLQFLLKFYVIYCLLWFYLTKKMFKFSSFMMKTKNFSHEKKEFKIIKD